MMTCTSCSKYIPGTVKSPLIALGRGNYHYECFRKKYVDPMFTGEPEVGEEKDPSASEKEASGSQVSPGEGDRNSDFSSARAELSEEGNYKMGSQMFINSHGTPRIQGDSNYERLNIPKPSGNTAGSTDTRGKNPDKLSRTNSHTRYRLVELREGVPTGWTHDYSKKESAEKKAYRLNIGGGVITYKVEDVVLTEP